jgi:hypothetical protein
MPRLRRFVSGNRSRIMRLVMLALVIVPRPAGAIVLVEDIPAITQQIKSLAQDLKAYEVYVQQLQQAVQQVEWASSTFESLVAHPSLPSAMAAMGMAGIENPLPVSPYAVQGLISGYGGAGGLSAITSRLGALGGLVNSSYSANHIYTPTDNTYASQQLQNGATGVAGAQGIAQSIMAADGGAVPGPASAPQRHAVRHHAGRTGVGHGPDRR